MGLTGYALDDVARQSLAVQTRFLRERLEIHLLGNHLWANAKALYSPGRSSTASRLRPGASMGWRCSARA